MSYEKKALGALDKILDALVYEEGNLAIINKYGTFLSEEDKVQATQLITAQRANLDRLFEIVKNDLDPLMGDICKNGEAMAPLVAKLISAEMIAKQMVFQQEVDATKANASATVSEEPVMTGSIPADTGFVASENAATEENAVVVNDNVSDGSAEVQNTGSEEAAIANASTGDGTPATVAGDAAVSASESEVGNVVDNSGVTETPAADVPVSGENTGVDTGTTTEVVADTAVNDSAIVSDGVDNNVGGTNEVVNETATESTPAAFVLSPIDEGVSTVPPAEEVKAAEETVAAADQQLQAIDNMKTEITSDPNLTEEEKQDKLVQYTRMTDATVRAILVTKVQAEKLLASRDAQKALLTKGNEVGATESEVAIPSVADAPAAESETATDEVKVSEATGDATVVLPTVGNEVAPSETPAPVAEAAPESSVVLPMIGADATVGDSTPAPVEQPAAEQGLSNVVLEIPGAAPAAEVTTDAQNNANELQTMIEQANALYKDGKVDEAKAMFEKIGAMNGQAGQPAGEVQTDANVLVKK